MNRKYILVVIVVVLLAGIGAGSWYFFGLKRERQIQPPQAATPLILQEIEKEFFIPGDLSSTELVQLYPNAVVPTIGVRPGSSVIQFFDKSERRFVRLDIAAKKSERISSPVEGDVYAALWSPDLTRAVAVFTSPASGERPAVALYDMKRGQLFNFDSRLVNFVWKDNNTLWAQVVSPDSNDFALISLESGVPGETVLRVPAHLGMVSGTFDASGKYFAFSGIGVSSATRNIYIYDIQTETTRQLTEDNKSVLPQWSPDGSWIVFTHIRDTAAVEEQWELRAMRKDGTENHSLGVTMPAPVFSFLDNSTVAAAVSAKIPEVCRDRNTVATLSQCYAYGDVISKNTIVKTSIANPAATPLADELILDSFGFPRVNNLTYIPAGRLLIFIDLRDSKLYAIQIRQ